MGWHCPPYTRDVNGELGEVGEDYSEERLQFRERKYNFWRT